jgi:YHS domain-containing protein
VTPLRLLIIGVLLYILYRLLTGPRKKVRDRKQSSGSGAVQDVLVEDPVCHAYVPKRQAIQLHHNKKMYYFCSDKCCEMFLKNEGAEE